MANNIHKKLTDEDKFARRWYCQRAGLNQIRVDKRRQRRQYRQFLRKTIEVVIKYYD